MVKSCCAPGCRNRCTSDSSLKFHRFPVNKERRALWIAAVRREQWKPTEHSVLCSAHFASGSKSNNPLSPDYVPTLFSHSSTDERRRARSRTWRPTREEWPRVSEDQRLLCICQALKREELRKSQRQNQNHQRTRKEQ